MKTTRSVTIHAPIERAFACVADNDNVKKWAQGVEEIIPREPWNPANPVGSRFTQKIREGGRLSAYEGEVVAYDAPRHMAITLDNPQFTMRVDYRFSEIPGGTRLDYTAETIQSNWVGRIFGVLFGWLTNRILDKQMAALKALAEQDGDA